MDRRLFLSGSLGLGAAGLSGQSRNTGGIVPTDDVLVEKAARAALAMQRFSWEHGILAQAFFEAGSMDVVILMTRAALLNATPDGRLAAVGGGACDPAMGGEAYWRAGEVTGDPQLQEGARNLLEFLLKRAPRAADGTLYHLMDAPEMWSDNYSNVPTYYAATGHYDEAVFQIEGFRKRLWDPRKKLLSHRWDDAKKEFVRRDFWGVGNGWAAAGMARVVHCLPPSRDNDRKHVAAFVKDIIDGCLAYQRKDGLFHDIVDRPDTFVETNLAQMLAYAIYSGVLESWLPADYVPAANQMRAAARAKVDRYGFVQGVCGAPRFDHAGIAVEGQAAFIRMEAAAKRFQQRKT